MVVGAIKTLIIGASGMLGSDLCKVFPYAVKLTHHDLDITDKEQVIESILKIKPDVVINAAAYTNVDGYESSKKLVFFISRDLNQGNIETCMGEFCSFQHILYLGS